MKKKHSYMDGEETAFCEYPDILTIKDVMVALKIGRHAVYKLIKSGQLQHFSVSNSYRIPKEALKTYVKNKGQDAISLLL